MRLAQIEGGIVINVIEVNPKSVPAWAEGWPDGQNAGVGWAYDGKTFTPSKTNIDALRASAAVPRADFCNGLADIGLLKDDEAVAAAKGAWPSPMGMFLDYLDDRQRRDVQIEWATRATIERNHWAVLAMISFGIATEAQADTLCGIPDLGK